MVWKYKIKVSESLKDYFSESWVNQMKVYIENIVDIIVVEKRLINLSEK